MALFGFSFAVKSKQIISHHLSGRSISPRSVCTSWLWMEMLSSKVRVKLDGFHVSESCVYFSESFMTRESPEIINGTEICEYHIVMCANVFVYIEVESKD